MSWKKQYRRFARGRKGAEPVPGNVVFEEFLKVYRSRLLRQMGGNRLAPESVRSRRASEEKVRRIITPFRFRPKRKIPVDVLAFRCRASYLIDSLFPDRQAKWLPPLQRVRRGADVELALKGLSFLEAPESTLQQIVGLLKAEGGAADIRLHFDDEKCVDVAPYLFLAMMWGDLTPIISGGRMTTEVQKVIEAVQLRRPLRMGRFRQTVDDWEIRAFPLQRRRAANTSRSVSRYLDPQSREQVQDAFVSAIDTWLDQWEIRQELTAHGRGHIKNIIGEVLDNAERHSMPKTMDGDWTIAGFMARREDARGIRFECSIAFISVGATISESLETSPPAVAATVDAYVRRHQHLVDPEVLRTVMAIQDGITRVAESAKEHRGGTGFQDVFDLVNDLGDHNLADCGPKVTIVSGAACLRIHPPYVEGMRDPGDRYAPRELWFNERNDSAEPPDPDYVFRLSKAFPGTLVTMSFVFEPMESDGVGNVDD